MRNTKWVSTVINGVLVVCALVVTGLVVRQDLFPASAAAATPQRQQVTQVSNWRQYAAQGHRWGPAEAPVEIVVFSDYQCPACRKLAQELRAIRAESPDVAVIERHMPLRGHPFALAAARAGECAARQGRFQEYHHALFDAQPEIGLTSWSEFARTAGVPDLPAFDRCVAADQPVPALAADTAAARELGITSTPTFIVNGTQVIGAPSVETLRGFVDRARAQAAAEAAGRRAAAR